MLYSAELAKEARCTPGQVDAVGAFHLYGPDANRVLGISGSTLNLRLEAATKRIEKYLDKQEVEQRRRHGMA